MIIIKTKFDQDQFITSSDVSRGFGTIRKQAREKPLVVTENGRFDTMNNQHLTSYALNDKIVVFPNHLFQLIMEDVMSISLDWRLTEC